MEYEQLRRKIESQARELSYFTSDQMNKITDKLSDDDKKKWRNVMSRFSDQNRSVFFFKEICISLFGFFSSEFF